MRRPATASDDTVIFRARRRPVWRWGAWAAAGAVVAAGLLAWVLLAWMVQPRVPPLPLMTEAAIAQARPTVRTVMRFAANPAVVVVDFPDLAEQGRMLNRLGVWAEKDGAPRDRLLDDAALDATIRAAGLTPDTFYFGHDYRGSEIARFFALAARDRVALRAEEEALRAIVARAQAEPAGFGALITLTATDATVTPAFRRTILHHELSHGEFFTAPAYAAHVARFWAALTEAERALVREYLRREGYDPALEELMMNEMQAYLMHTDDPVFFDPAKLGIPAPRLAALRAQFFATMPEGWLRPAR